MPSSRPARPQAIAADILKGLAALAAIGEGTGAAAAQALPGPDSARRTTPTFPSLDPLMALGTSTPLFDTLAHWQQARPADGARRGLAAPKAAGEAGATSFRST